MNLTKKQITFVFIGIISTWAISGLIIYYSFNDSSDRGTFGDMFGAINALFSGLALFGVIVTILIQQKELHLQRKELTETRLEFQINRITNIIYNQLNKVQDKIENLSFIKPFDNALSDDILQFEFINSIFNEYKHERIDPNVGRKLWEERKSKTNLKEVININQHELNKIISLILSSCQIMNNLIKDKSIPNKSKNNLKDLFFVNLDSELLNMIQNLDSYLQESFDDFKIMGLEDPSISKMKRNLESIIKYKNYSEKEIS